MAKQAQGERGTVAKQFVPECADEVDHLTCGNAKDWFPILILPGECVISFRLGFGEFDVGVFDQFDLHNLFVGCCGFRGLLLVGWLSFGCKDLVIYCGRYFHRTRPHHRWLPISACTLARGCYLHFRLYHMCYAVVNSN